MAPFWALAMPIGDLVRPMAYPQIYLPEQGDFHPTTVAHTMSVDQVDQCAAETIVERLHASDATMRAAQLWVLGGTMARVPADATAFAHRASRIMVNLAAFYQGPEDQAARQAWVDQFAAALGQEDSGAYVGFLATRAVPIHQAYPPATWQQLAQVRARYDPANLFRRA